MTDKKNKVLLMATLLAHSTINTVYDKEVSDFFNEDTIYQPAERIRRQHHRTPAEAKKRRSNGKKRKAQKQARKRNRK